MDEWGRLDGLVNNAGTTRFSDQADLEGQTAEDFHAIYSVNVVGPYQMSRAAAAVMERGAIVNIASMAGVVGTGSSIAYAASKGALNTMTLSLARVLAPGIRVNAVCPGFVQGEWMRAGLGNGAIRGDPSAPHREQPARRARHARGDRRGRGLVPRRGEQGDRRRS